MPASFDADLKVRADHLNRILERERTRADRGGRPLSMILVGYDGKSRRRGDASVIVHVMQKRGRITDEIGWFDKHTGFAVLPDTPAQGAKRFAEIVRHQLRDRGVRASYALYQYDPPRQDDHSSGHGRGGHGGGQPHRTRPEALPPAARREAELEPAVAWVGIEPGSVSVRELQPLMARGLPLWKRAGDVAVAGSALTLAWPLLLGIGLAIKLDSAGPVLFKQRRSGLGGRPFDIWKFRTMVPDAEQKRNDLLAINEQDGPAFKIKADPRVTRIGGFLRKTSLDELPQLVNVLRGDMTLVGPRPLPVKESEACEPWQKRRMDVTPGLTCIWQVWGRSTVTFSEWCRMDLRYQARRTLRHDLKILLATIPAVLRQRGAC
ncbi:MAG: sugar transferase [Planctomycetota bacterium]